MHQIQIPRDGPASVCPAPPLYPSPFPRELDHLLAARAVGGAMEPKVSDGDLAIFNPRRRDPADGDMVVVNRDGDLAVRWARRRSDGQLVFVANDGTALDTSDAEIVRVEGTVLMIERTPSLRPRPGHLAPSWMAAWAFERHSEKGA